MNDRMFAMTGVAAAALLMAGCASTPTVREVALDRAPISSKLEPQDVRRTVEKMTESLLSAPGVREAVGGTARRLRQHQLHRAGGELRALGQRRQGRERRHADEQRPAGGVPADAARQGWRGSIHRVVRSWWAACSSAARARSIGTNDA